MPGNKVSVTALRATPYSNDGFTILMAKPGETFPISADLVQSLVDEKFVERATAAALNASADILSLVGDAPSAPAVQAPSTPSSAASPQIPDGWRDFHHLKIIQIAKQFDPDVKLKSDAIAVIEAEEAKAQV